MLGWSGHKTKDLTANIVVHHVGKDAMFLRKSFGFATGG